MKKFWFFFPLKYLLKALGGIPVDTNASRSLTTSIIEDFKNRKKLNIAVTPEGSRSAVDIWRTGFLTISYKAGVPIQLGVIDFKNKKVIIVKEFTPTGNNEEDLKKIRNYYADFKTAALYPEKFNA